MQNRNIFQFIMEWMPKHHYILLKFFRVFLLAIVWKNLITHMTILQEFLNSRSKFAERMKQSSISTNHETMNMCTAKKLILLFDFSGYHGIGGMQSILLHIYWIKILHIRRNFEHTHTHDVSWFGSTECFELCCMNLLMLLHFFIKNLLSLLCTTIFCCITESCNHSQMLDVLNQTFLLSS